MFASNPVASLQSLEQGLRVIASCFSFLSLLLREGKAVEEPVSYLDVEETESAGG